MCPFYVTHPALAPGCCNAVCTFVLSASLLDAGVLGGTWEKMRGTATAVCCCTGICPCIAIPKHLKASRGVKGTHSHHTANSTLTYSSTTLVKRTEDSHQLHMFFVFYSPFLALPPSRECFCHKTTTIFCCHNT